MDRGKTAFPQVFKKEGLRLTRTNRASQTARDLWLHPSLIQGRQRQLIGLGENAFSGECEPKGRGGSRQ